MICAACAMLCRFSWPLECALRVMICAACAMLCRFSWPSFLTLGLSRALGALSFASIDGHGRHWWRSASVFWYCSAHALLPTWAFVSSVLDRIWPLKCSTTPGLWQVLCYCRCPCHVLLACPRCHLPSRPVCLGHHWSGEQAGLSYPAQTYGPHGEGVSSLRHGLAHGRASAPSAVRRCCRGRRFAGFCAD